MPISVFTQKSAAPSCVWEEEINQEWFAGPGSYFPLDPSFNSDEGELGLAVDGPWASDLDISGIRITFSGASSVDLEIYLDSGPPSILFENYTSGQEIEIEISSSVDPLYGLFMTSSGPEFSVTSIEFCVTPPEPIDPAFLDMVNYTNDVYWENTSEGTFNTQSYDTGDGSWTSINDSGADYITLLAKRRGTDDPNWADYYRPTYARIYFTGVSTVDVIMQQGFDGIYSPLANAEGVSSGDVITLNTFQDNEPFGDPYRLTDIYIGNSPGTGQFTVTRIELGHYITQLARGCVDFDELDAQFNICKYPDTNESDTVEIEPSAHAAVEYHPYTDLDIDESFYPFTITSDADNFNVIARDVEGGVLLSQTTTNGVISDFIQANYFSEFGVYGKPPLRVIVENDEPSPGPCNIFTMQLGTDIQQKATQSAALDDPVMNLLYEETNWDGFPIFHLPVVMTVDSGRYGAVRFSKNGGYSGYNATIISRSGSVDGFYVALYDGNKNFLDSTNDTGGVAQIYITFPGPNPPTDDFYIVVGQGVLRSVSDFIIRVPQPF